MRKSLVLLNCELKSFIFTSVILLYAVLYTNKGGGVLVEEGVVSEWIRYRFSLQALQSQLRNIVMSPQNSRRIGIRKQCAEKRQFRINYIRLRWQL